MWRSRGRVTARHHILLALRNILCVIISRHHCREGDTALADIGGGSTDRCACHSTARTLRSPSVGANPHVLPPGPFFSFPVLTLLLQRSQGGGSHSLARLSWFLRRTMRVGGFRSR